MPVIHITSDMMKASILRDIGLYIKIRQQEKKVSEKTAAKEIFRDIADTIMPELRRLVIANGKDEVAKEIFKFLFMSES